MEHPFNVVLYGGDYNPEQWPKEIWKEDLRLFDLAGINSATVNGATASGQMMPASSCLASMNAPTSRDTPMP